MMLRGYMQVMFHEQNATDSENAQVLYHFFYEFVINDIVHTEFRLMFIGSTQCGTICMLISCDAYY